MESFQSLPEAKRNRIMNAAFDCFAGSGYRKASVGDIALAAGISKASVFHYFHSKKELYLYLYDFSVNVITQAVFKGMRTASDDFFTRIWEAQRIKMEVIEQYGGMFDFLFRSIRESDAEVIGGMRKHNQAYILRGFSALFEGVRWEKFRPGIDREQVTNLVTWVSNGYAKHAVEQGKAADEMGSEVFEYLDLLKAALYKEEYLHEHDRS